MADAPHLNPANEAKAILSDAARALHGDWNKNAWADETATYADLAQVNRDPAYLKRVTAAMQSDQSVVALEKQLGISVQVKPDGSVDITPTGDKSTHSGPEAINYKALDDKQSQDVQTMADLLKKADPSQSDFQSIADILHKYQGADSETQTAILRNLSYANGDNPQNQFTFTYNRTGDGQSDGKVTGIGYLGMKMGFDGKAGSLYE